MTTKKYILIEEDGFNIRVNLNPVYVIVIIKNHTKENILRSYDHLKEILLKQKVKFLEEKEKGGYQWVDVMKFFFKDGKLKSIKVIGYGSNLGIRDDTVEIFSDKIIIFFYEVPIDYRFICSLMVRAFRIFTVPEKGFKIIEKKPKNLIRAARFMEILSLNNITDLD